MAYGLTSSGLSIKRFADIINELQFAAKAAMGDSLTFNADESQLPHLINIFGEPISELWELAQDVHDSFDPNSAEGTSLDARCDLVGVDRQPATYSTVTVTAVGTAGTVLPAGRIISNLDDPAVRFATIADATIPAGGSVDIECQAQTAGAVEANAGTLTSIETPVSGWSRVYNNDTAEVGNPLENDTTLRNRREEDLAVVGAATCEAIRAALEDEVTGVTDAFVFENEGDDTDDNGIPGHNYHIIVAGGDEDEIAEKIWLKKAGGIGTAGVGNGTTVNITAIVDVGCNRVRIVCDAAHGLSNGDSGVIAGTSDYDGGYKAYNVGAGGGDDFEIVANFTTTDTGTFTSSVADEIRTVTDSMGDSHTIRYDRADEVDVWMHVILKVTSDFDTGAKRKDTISIDTYDASSVYTVMINGVSFTATGAGSALATAASLVTDINDHVSNGWVPVTATDNLDGTFQLESDYAGCNYTLAYSATGSGAISNSEDVENSGDQQGIIDDIADFANGTDAITKEQSIGEEVSLSRYYSPINQTGEIKSISIYVASGSQPTTAPTDVTDWSQGDADGQIQIAATERAALSAIKTTVEITT